SASVRRIHASSMKPWSSDQPPCSASFARSPFDSATARCFSSTSVLASRAHAFVEMPLPTTTLMLLSLISSSSLGRALRAPHTPNTSRVSGSCNTFFRASRKCAESHRNSERHRVPTSASAPCGAPSPPLLRPESWDATRRLDGLHGVLLMPGAALAVSAASSCGQLHASRRLLTSSCPSSAAESQDDHRPPRVVSGAASGRLGSSRRHLSLGEPLDELRVQRGVVVAKPHNAAMHRVHALG